MEPFIRTIIIITGNHVSVTDAATGTVDLGILVTLVLLLIVHVIVRTSRLAPIFRIRHIGAAEHGVVFVVIAAGGGRLLRHAELDAPACAGGALGWLSRVACFDFLDLLVGGDFLGDGFLDSRNGSWACAARATRRWCTGFGGAGAEGRLSQV
jgi:hypothetical protein